MTSWDDSPVSTASSAIAVPASSRQSAGTTCSALFSPVWIHLRILYRLQGLEKNLVTPKSHV